jgi:zinc/manganese transport system substrate-binding protein/manganese/iron transport system substrate-binding protein
LALALVALLVAACSSDDKKAGDNFPGIKNPPTVTPGQKVNVVATTTQVADFARQIGGDRINLTDLVKPGVDPHEYEPTPQDARDVAQANLIAINGVGLESYIGKLLEQAGGNKPVVVLSKGVKIRKGSDDEKEGDPHIWLNPQNAKIMVDNLAQALGKVDPAGAATYTANATAYKAKLDDLDARIKAQIDSIPKDRRKLVTNHDAFGYYIDHYGLTFVGSVIPSLDTNAAPSAQQVADIVKKIKEQKVPAIFTESSINPKLEEQIAQDAGVKVVATLYADSLGPSDSPGGTYLGMMEFDTKAIVDGLK